LMLGVLGETFTEQMLHRTYKRNYLVNSNIHYTK
jgi:hypothetical protein